MVSGKLFRLFVSSTFSDFVAERTLQLLMLASPKSKSTLFLICIFLG
jgi:hypothetical protein